MDQPNHILKELFPKSLQHVEEILWTARSKLEMRCSIKYICESHIILQPKSDIPEVGTRGIVWLPHFKIFPVVVSERTEGDFTAKFEDLDSRSKKMLDFFVSSRESGAKIKRPNMILRAVYKAKQLLPTLSRVVANVPSLVNAELSVLAPGAELRLHKARFRCFLRMHLGIIIPKGDVCLELEGNRIEWQEGKVMLFDDFYPHTAWNRTEQTRVILMVDLLRPMPKWQEYFLRLVQRYEVPPQTKIPKEWLNL